MTEARYRLRLARWPEDANQLQLVREKVFVIEQNVPHSLEWDGLDAESLHMLAETPDKHPIGTGRLLPDGHIGRMAVLADWRGQGVGSALLSGLIEEGRSRGFAQLILNAQVRAIAFYERQGFKAEGETFDEAGIPHRRMVLPLRDH